MNSLSKAKLKILYFCWSHKSDAITEIVSLFVLNKLGKPSTHLNEEEKTYLTIPFNCRNVDYLKLSSLMRKTSVQKLLPEAAQSYYPPKLFFQYNNPVFISLCNYSKFLKNLKFEDIKAILNQDCVCVSNSTYVYEPHKHIITGGS